MISRNYIKDFVYITEKRKRIERLSAFFSYLVERKPKREFLRTDIADYFKTSTTVVSTTLAETRISKQTVTSKEAKYLIMDALIKENSYPIYAVYNKKTGKLVGRTTVEHVATRAEKTRDYIIKEERNVLMFEEFEQKNGGM